MTMAVRPIYRPDPLLPAESMKTYAIAAPVDTHFRLAPCSEVECPGWREGWKVPVDIGSKLGQAQARYIRDKAGRAFTIDRDAATPGLITFYFPAGQQCFTPHQVPLERPAMFYVVEGDWRGNPRRIKPRIHRTADDWRDDFAEHQDAILTAQARG